MDTPDAWRQMLWEALGADAGPKVMRLSRRLTSWAMENTDTVHLHVQRWLGWRVAPLPARLHTALQLTEGARDVHLRLTISKRDLPLELPSRDARLLSPIRRLTVQPEEGMPWSGARLQSLVQGMVNLDTLVLDARPTKAFATAVGRVLRHHPSLRSLEMEEDCRANACYHDIMTVLCATAGPYLRSLAVCRIEDCTALRQFPALEELTVAYWPRDADVEALQAHPRLTKLKLRQARTASFTRLAPWLRADDTRELHVGGLGGTVPEDTLELIRDARAVKLGLPHRDRAVPELRKAFVFDGCNQELILAVLPLLSREDTLVELHSVNLLPAVLEALPPHVRFARTCEPVNPSEPAWNWTWRDVLCSLPPHMRSVSLDFRARDGVQALHALPASGLRADRLHRLWT